MSVDDKSSDQQSAKIQTCTYMQPEDKDSYSVPYSGKDTIAPTMELFKFQRAAWAMAAMKMKGPNSVTIQRG